MERAQQPSRERPRDEVTARCCETGFMVTAMFGALIKGDSHDNFNSVDSRAAGAHNSQ